MAPSSANKFLVSKTDLWDRGVLLGDFEILDSLSDSDSDFSNFSARERLRDRDRIFVNNLV